MTDHKALTMIKCLGVFGMATRSILKRAINDEDDLPGEPFDGVKRLGEAFGLLLRQALQGLNRYVVVKFQQFRELRLVHGRKPGRFFKGMFGRDHHQKEEISGTDPFEALTDLNMTCNPGAERVIWHGV